MEPNNTYLSELQDWRREADDNLRGAESWLSLLGLYWLDEGENRCGTDDDNTIVFPPGTSPGYFATFNLKDGAVSLVPINMESLTVDGGEAKQMILKADVSGEPSEIRLGSLLINVVERGDRFGLRVWDSNNPKIKEFPGRTWFEPSVDFRLDAKFTSYDPPKIMPITNILGDTSDGKMVGEVSFIVDGKSHTLAGLEGADGRLFIIFRDETSKNGTYPGGRYLYTDAPENGLLDLDFNRAYNPPCAFTNFATCPLPPPQNHLALSIEAGERYTEF